MTLDELALLHGTDKSSTGHWYTRHYEAIFGWMRLNVEALCEVGIGSGGSLLMWRDYFPNAVIYGVDQNHTDDMGARIVLHEIEQTDCQLLYDNLHDRKLEIIVEDASHDQDKTMKTLDCLWPILRSRGWYVIEDMNRHLFPKVIGEWCGEHSSEVKQLQVLNNRDQSAAIGFIQKQ